MEENQDLFVKFLDGRCTGEEFLQVNQLLENEVEYIKLFNLIKQRENYELDNPPVPSISMQEWVRSLEPVMQQRIAIHERRNRLFFSRTILRWSSIAAIFVSVIVLTNVMLWNNSDYTGLSDGKTQVVQYAELANPGGIPKLYFLPDGTKIWLAAGSTLKYPEQFAKKRRGVELSGEAFFDVTRDEQRPFTIRTGDIETCVLGTSFKITAFSGQEQEISVATGKVSVSSNGQEVALLTRGLQVRHNSETGENTRTEIDPATLEQWKTGVLIFDKQPLNLVAEQLERRYGIDIEFANRQIGIRRIRGVFASEEQVETIMELLSIAGNFRYRKSGEKHYKIY